MTLLLNKIFLLALIDIFLSGIDLIEISKTGCLEDYFEEPYDFEDSSQIYWIKEIIEPQL